MGNHDGSWWTAQLCLLLWLGSGVSLAQQQTAEVPGGPKLKLEGIILARSGPWLQVGGYRGEAFRVRVQAGTEIEEQKQNPFRSPKPYSLQHLIPGLPVRVEGRRDTSGSILAREIKFTQDDLKVARAISSRLEPVARDLDASRQQLEEQHRKLEHGLGRTETVSGQVEEITATLKLTRSELNRVDERSREALLDARQAQQRIDALDEYRVAAIETVHFSFDSADLSEAAQEALDNWVREIDGQRGYLLEIRGFASADGDSDYNRMLSARRASRVARYLHERHALPLHRMVPPYGYGDTEPVRDNGTPEGRRENRRVEVRLLVNDALRETDHLSARVAQQRPF